MIENDLQYDITSDLANKFRDSIESHDRRKRPDDIHPRLWQAMRDAMQSQLQEFSDDLADYDRKAKVNG